MRIVVIALLLGGCLGIGETAARLRGTLEVASGASDCTLRLLADGVEIDARELHGGPFEETFLLPIGVRAYTATITCEGTVASFERTLELGELQHYRPGVGLGHIEL